MEDWKSEAMREAGCDNFLFRGSSLRNVMCASTWEHHLRIIVADQLGEVDLSQTFEKVLVWEVRLGRPNASTGNRRT
jgi:hypothetical protein